MARRIEFEPISRTRLVGGSEVSATRQPDLERLNISLLRKAIRSNRFSFPSQVPVFSKHDRPDLQSKIVLLYFLLGWSCSRIGARYRLRRQRVQQILSTWARRAIEIGYLQRIPSVEALQLGPRENLRSEVLATIPAVAKDARARAASTPRAHAV
jgi:hypothetical protein